MNRFNLAILVAGLVLLPANALASWSWDSNRLQTGGDRIRAVTWQNGIAVSIACEPDTGPDVFQLEIEAQDLPYLDATDNAQESLVLRFDESDRQFNAFDGWADVWYSAEDRLWKGGLYLESEGLDAFGGASIMRILNSFGQEVARFTMDGSRLSERAMRAVCHDGMTTSQWHAEHDPSASAPTDVQEHPTFIASEDHVTEPDDADPALSFPLPSQQNAEISALSKAVDADSTNPDVYTARGEYFRLNGQFHAAIEDFLEAVNLDPLNASRRGVLATAYLGASRFDLALETALTGLSLDPDEWRSIHVKCQALRFQKKYADAVPACEAALKIDSGPDYPESYGNVLHALAVAQDNLDNTDVALALYDRLIAREEHLVQAHFAKGLIYVRALSFVEAETEMAAALRYDPANLSAKAGLAVALAMQGRSDEASLLAQDVLADGSDSYASDLAKLALDIARD